MTYAHIPPIGLIDRIYEGTVDAQAWVRIVAQLREYLGSPKARLFTPFLPREDGGLVIADGMAEGTIAEWSAHLRTFDVWANAGIAKGLMQDGAAVIDEDLVQEREFLQSRIYREHLSRFGIARLCSGVIFAGDRSNPTTLFNAYRDLGDARYGERERSALRGVIPHLSRALGVMYRLREADLKVTATVAALDRLSTGVALVDNTGSIVHLNRAAERMVSLRDGISPDGIERAVRPSGANSAGTAHFSAATVEIARPSRKRSFVLQFAPLPEGNEFCQGSKMVNGIVFITDQERGMRLEPGLLRDLYGITLAEARLALLLCSGESVTRAAQRCGISQSTARSQLASLFEKTSTRRQADLVKLLTGLASQAF